MKNLYFLLVILLFTGISCKKSTSVDKNRNVVEEKVDSVLSLMSLEEKIGQMQQLHVPRGADDSIAGLVRAGKVGSCLNVGPVSLANRLQKTAVEESGTGIPLILGRDVIHGFRTIFPIPLGQAASWNTDLVEKAARIAATEASAQGIDWTFAPMIDIARDPRWGRIAEGCGEDPYLTSEMAIAMCNGFQNDFADSTSLVACAKHFVGYGAAEGGKDYNNTLIPETELRNIYLRPFEAFARNGGLTYMSAFNNLNGIPASGNEFTLRRILRNEWNFDGFVVSDWNSLSEMIVHGYCKDESEVAEKGIKAGVDMEMVSDAYGKNLALLVKKGVVDEKVIDEAVRNILRVKFRAGLFDNPYTTEQIDQPKPDPYSLEIAKELAVESCVLLKNENNLLPLDQKINKIAVIGPLADSPSDQLGTWVMDNHDEDTKTPLQAFKELFGENKIIYEKGLLTPRDNNSVDFAKVLSAVRRSDIVLLFLGEDALLSGENHSRAFLRLPGKQEEIIRKISETGKPVVAVIMAGRPLILANVEEHLDAILYAWHPGTMGGPAIADLLTGKSIPSGKLTISFPRFEGQIPVYYNHYNTGRPPSDYNKGKPVGEIFDPIQAAAAYLDLDYTPRYPFGYGLSYTTFEYSDLTLSKDAITLEDTLKVSVTVKNTGMYGGKETVQLYIHDLYGSITRPVKELKGFQKIYFNAGEIKQVEFKLAKDDLSFYDNKGEFIAEPGDFEVYVGTNSEELLVKRFQLK